MNETRKIRIAAGGPVADQILAAYRDGNAFALNMRGDVFAKRSPDGAEPVESTHNDDPVWELDIVIINPA